MGISQSTTTQKRARELGTALVLINIQRMANRNFAHASRERWSLTTEYEYLDIALKSKQTILNYSLVVPTRSQYSFP
jgi:hypothetical protein